MKYTFTDDRWESFMTFIDRVIDNPDAYPNEGAVLPLSNEEITTLFTKKRLELIRLIQAERPGNLSELSKLAKRKISAVERDLQLLKNFRIVGLEKKGKNVQPKVIKDVLIIPLIDLKAKKLEEIKAKA